MRTSNVASMSHSIPRQLEDGFLSECSGSRLDHATFRFQTAIAQREEGFLCRHAQIAGWHGTGTGTGNGTESGSERKGRYIIMIVILLLFLLLFLLLLLLLEERRGIQFPLCRGKVLSPVNPGVGTLFSVANQLKCPNSSTDEDLHSFRPCLANIHESKFEAEYRQRENRLLFEFRVFTLLYPFSGIVSRVTFRLGPKSRLYSCQQIPLLIT